MKFWKRAMAAVTAGLLCVSSVPVIQTILPETELTADAIYSHHDTYDIFSFDEYFSDDAVSLEPGTGTHIWITGCDASVTSVEIPSEINGVPVTGIASGAFQACTSLTDVSIPDSVMDIGTDAFLNTPLLAEAEAAAVDGFVVVDGFLLESEQQGEVVIPAEAGVKTITSGAFNRELTSIVLPEGLERIGNAAFYFCEDLGNVTLPESLESIGASAFYHCTSMTKIVIPDHVTSIEESAFAECLCLTNVTLPANLTRIEDALFRTTNLTEINLPETLTDIGSSAFLGCDITSVVIPDGVTRIANSTFRLCDKLTSITLPSNLKSIDALAFYNCTQLTEIIIPDSVTSIGNFAFEDCTSLTDINIPETLMNFGVQVFDGTAWLEVKRAENPLVILNGVVIDGTTCSGEVEIPTDIVKIGPQAFYQCTTLTGITIPEHVIVIQKSAFYGCENLKEVILPDSVTLIGQMAFDGCTALTDVYYGGSSALWNNIKLYSDNEPLNNAAMHYGISYQQAEDNTFVVSGCDTDTAEAEIPAELMGMPVIGISSNAFAASGLTSLTLPGSIVQIEANAFNDCTQLNHVYYAGTMAQWQEILISDTGNGILSYATIHCSDGDIAPEIRPGDVDDNSTTDPNDAYLCLLAYAKQSVGSDSGLTVAQMKAADVDGDGSITANDAYYILLYYAKQSVGQDVAWEDIL
ncbi:leucine-rich repeat protein [uncultured Ruminococcus sp.]|uniref:leucine-rich repeat protein n=1 Tax=uncultured Ruminococcus sp. TaxID=165186 RepID=UPI002634CB9E|nr:leucine-rich repeat protein [uncultured Ruminococcus sp.]